MGRNAHDRVGAPRLAGGLSAPASTAGWKGQLSLRYWRDGARTVALDRHEGPLRVLQRLYPEGDGICHHVLVHPPGGVAGGDVLELQAELGAGTHAVITTPGATRFYRSGGRPARQSARLRLAPGARAEWLPLENIAYPGCQVENRTEIELSPGAEMLGWDLLALGLPASGAPLTMATSSSMWPCTRRAGRANRDLRGRQAAGGCRSGWSAAASTLKTPGCWIHRWAWRGGACWPPSGGPRRSR